MNNENCFFDFLWESIDVLNPYASKYEKEALKSVETKSKKVKNTMNEKQIELFDEYQNSLSELFSVLQREAFAKGIKFATRFFIESAEK